MDYVLSYAWGEDKMISQRGWFHYEAKARGKCTRELQIEMHCYRSEFRVIYTPGAEGNLRQCVSLSNNLEIPQTSSTCRRNQGTFSSWPIP